MKKRLALIICAGIMALALTGCGVSVSGLMLPENKEIQVGESEALSLTYIYNEDDADEAARQKAIDAAAVSWSVAGDAVTVNEKGVVAAQASGEATVTATTKDGHTASCVVTVTQPIEGIALLQTLSLSIGGEDHQTLAPDLTPKNAQGDITWSSSNDAVATVDANGTVKAVAKGTCIIKAEANGISAETAVTVTVAPTGITLAQNSGVLTTGSSTQLKVYTVPEAAEAADPAQLVYKSSNDAVATVDANGAVKAKKAGSTTITVTYQGQFTTEYALTVKAPAQQQTAKPQTGSTGSNPGASTPSVPTGGAGGASAAPSTPAPAPEPAPGGIVHDSPYVTLDPDAPVNDYTDFLS